MPTNLTPPPSLPLALQPLAESHEANALEAEFKAAVMEVFETMIRPRLTAVNTYGIAHRADFEVIERFVKADGLVMERANAEPFLAALYRAWRARNPRRGTHFLRHYLQLLYPNAWTVTQLWQPVGQVYPNGADGVEGPGKFLTSRLRVTVNTPDPSEDLPKLVGSFRAVIPARFVLEVSISAQSDPVTLRMGSAAQLSEYFKFEGTATYP